MENLGTEVAFFLRERASLSLSQLSVMDKQEGVAQLPNIHILKNISKHLHFENPEQVPKANVTQAGGVTTPGGLNPRR